MSNFHEVRFPLEIALGSRGGPERKTEVVTLASGVEERNARWMHSRRKYDAGYGVKSFSKLAEVVSFFEERRGKLYGFRFRDRLDWTSAPANALPSALDQEIGVGDGIKAIFQLYKTYGGAFAPYQRPITKPILDSVRVSVEGVELVRSVDFDVDSISGLIIFNNSKIPALGAKVKAGFIFDVPVRFDIDYLEFDLSSFQSGVIPSIPLVEIRG